MKDQFTSAGIDLEKAIAFWIYRAHQRLRSAAFGAMRESGFDGTPEQWVVLVRLWSSDGRIQAELLEDTVSDAPTLSRTLRSMERAGWVERRPDPRDGRARRVFLTPAGRALEKTLVPVVRQSVQRALRGIPDGDVRQARRTLEKIVTNLS